VRAAQRAVQNRGRCEVSSCGQTRRISRNRAACANACGSRSCRSDRRTATGSDGFATLRAREAVRRLRPA